MQKVENIFSFQYLRRRRSRRTTDTFHGSENWLGKKISTENTPLRSSELGSSGARVQRLTSSRLERFTVQARQVLAAPFDQLLVDGEGSRARFHVVCVESRDAVGKTQIRIRHRAMPPVLVRARGGRCVSWRCNGGGDYGCIFKKRKQNTIIVVIIIIIVYLQKISFYYSLPPYSALHVNIYLKKKMIFNVLEKLSVRSIMLNIYENQRHLDTYMKIHAIVYWEIFHRFRTTFSKYKSEKINKYISFRPRKI